MVKISTRHRPNENPSRSARHIAWLYKGITINLQLSLVRPRLVSRTRLKYSTPHRPANVPRIRRRAYFIQFRTAYTCSRVAVHPK
ncbi:unnamed protein product [Calypogeia fissa]